MEQFSEGTQIAQKASGMYDFIKLDPGSILAARLVSGYVELQDQFATALKGASEVWIATAWLRNGWALEQLVSHAAPVNAVIGMSFGQTDPDAIRAIQGLGGKVLLVPDEKVGVFHPKVYLFESDGYMTLFVGSVNMTHAAYTANTEVSFWSEVGSLQKDALMKMWARLSDVGQPVTDTILAALQRSFDKRQQMNKQHAALAIAAGEALVGQDMPKALSVLEIFSMSWPSYLALLKSSGADLSKYLETINVVRPLLLGPELPAPPSPEFDYMLGRIRAGSPDYGYLGTLKGSGYAVESLGKDKKVRSQISAALIELSEANDNTALLAAAEKIWAVTIRTRGMAHGVATRLLAITRPDKFLSVNSQSVRELAKLLDVPMSHLKKKDTYFSAIESLWQAPWCSSTSVSDPVDRSVWQARVALLDALVRQ